MSLFLTILVVVMSSLYVGAKRKERVLKKKTEELSNLVHLETWGVPSNLYSGIYKTENISSIVPADNSITKVEEKKPVYVEDCMDDAAQAFLDSLIVTASHVVNEQNMQIEDDMANFDEAIKMYEAAESFNNLEEQFIDPDDWELSVTEQNILLQYRDLADSSIADETSGLQTWVC
ncbi:hypothetical protein [Lysinibacillus xylanilyticus]|uniref:hypothetical protein n=1 Tax=Lysinibacillus xylanilyticus TaxID=582475 RepID=UPI003827F670